MTDRAETTQQADGGQQAHDYAGDVSVTDAWGVLQSDPSAVMVDVRTPAEWAYVGTADLGSVGKDPVCIPWQNYPGMELNAEFEAQMESEGVAKGVPVLFLCRSGARSAAAAKAMTAAGWGPCFNIADGFEGPLDGEKHRGSTGGWKAADLPWHQK